LAVVALAMFGFGYALVPMYRAICEYTGINVLALAEQVVPGARTVPGNTQVDTSRVVTVEFDANARGPWEFRPDQRSVSIHPGEVVTVMYEFQNTRNRRMSAQAIPSYAPQQAAAHFNKLECFCFQQYTLDAGEKKSWPVVFVVDPKLYHGRQNDHLVLHVFRSRGKTPAAPRTVKTQWPHGSDAQGVSQGWRV
jgi:cytochrome c oxidase assembly protein subunit 11